MFTIKVDHDKKTLEMVIGGVFVESDAEAFLKDYKSKVATLKPNQYTLIADCRKLQTSASNMMPILKNCVALYMEYPYKKRYTIFSESGISKSQMFKIGEEVGGGMQFVSSPSEIVL